jgi:hypothetical protein
MTSFKKQWDTPTLEPWFLDLPCIPFVSGHLLHLLHLLKYRFSGFGFPTSYLKLLGLGTKTNGLCSDKPIIKFLK